MFKYLPKNKRAIRFIMNIWPPFLFAGISITELADDFKSCTVKLKNCMSTRNVNGAQYGGSLFSMTDPIYSMMLIFILGDKYYVWDKEAEIEFKKPGLGAVFLKCEVSDELLQNIYEQTKSGDKYLPVISDDLYNEKGEVVASVKRTMYVRLKPEFRPEKRRA